MVEKHLFFEGRARTTGFTSKKRGPSPEVFPRGNPAAHEAYLAGRLNAAWSAAAPGTEAVAVRTRTGVYLDFISPPGHKIYPERLESQHIGMSVRAVHEVPHGETTRVRVTAFVSEEHRLKFLRKLHAYGTQLTRPSAANPTGAPKNAPLMANIDEITRAMVGSLWPPHEVHKVPRENPEWCECWVIIPESNSLTTDQERKFQSTAEQVGIVVDPKRILFPERIVFYIKASLSQLSALLDACDEIAEFRSAGIAANLWTGLEADEQRAWVAEAATRVRPPQADSPAICILDTGVNHRHRLLSPVLVDVDRHAVDVHWGLHDHYGPHGHGTGMAGLVAYGRLEPLLMSQQVIEATHRLESVKIIPPNGSNPKALYGSISAMAVAKVEVQAPTRLRSFCMAITSSETRNAGRPTSWSGAIDALACGRYEGDDGSQRRLFLISAGNVDMTLYRTYPASNELDAINDPAQSWNALTFGGFTELVDLRGDDLEGHTAVAAHGGLSPHSTTSTLWERNKWPLKPDVVFEAGNLVLDRAGDLINHASVQLLALSSHPDILDPLTSVCGTSPATALGANLVGQIHAGYPQAWTETIRGLVVHSAEWTPGMRGLLQPDETEATLLPMVGWGVPSAAKALACARNRLTLIAERSIQPFGYEIYDAAGIGHGRRKTKEMHLYDLPWPVAELRSMGETPVRIRVTLSYFIEPSPGEKGWSNRYRYQSHGLRFEMCRPGETPAQLHRRISRYVEDEETGEVLPQMTTRSAAADQWVLGPNARNRGSIHSDVWHGTAVQAAACSHIAVHPVTGWWRDRPHKQRVESLARYSLIVSVETDAAEIDIYTPVKTQITVPITV